MKITFQWVFFSFNVQIKNETNSYLIWKVPKINWPPVFASAIHSFFSVKKTFLHDPWIIKWQHAAKETSMLGQTGNISACLTSTHPFALTNTVAVRKNTCLKQHIQHLNQLSHIFLKWWTRAASLAFFAEFVTEPGDAWGRRKCAWYRHRHEWSECKHEHFLEAQRQWKTRRLLFPKEQSIFLL